MGEVAVGAIQAEFEQRIETLESSSASCRAPGAAGRAFTTRKMLDLERGVVEMMRAGQNSQSGVSLSDSNRFLGDGRTRI